LGPICRKEDSIFRGKGCGNDWMYIDLCNGHGACDTGEMIQLFDSGKFEMDFEVSDRDGCFNYDQLFAVFSEDDVSKLIKAILNVTEDE